jgi:drug/metabolite transporter (DMT)-like permease
MGVDDATRVAAAAGFRQREVAGVELAVIVAFAALYVVWGSTFLAIRYAVETVPPLLMMAVRCLLGGGILLAIGFARDPRARLPDVRQWGAATAIGLMLFVCCHGVLAITEQHVASGMAALCLATIPLFVPLLAWATRDSRPPTARTTVALLAGFAGVALLVASQGATGGLQVGWALVLLFTAFSWAAGTVATRHLAQPASPLIAAAAALLTGGVLLTVMSIVSGEATSFHPSAVSEKSLGGLAYLVVFGTVCTFSAYVWLLRQVPPARVATYAFVNPVVAVLLGWAVASEPISAGTVLAAAVIVVAVAVAVTERRRVPAVVEGTPEPQ